jgi:hypothetical protein
MNEITQQPIVLKGPEISRQIFGGVLDYDGAGHYPGLELLNFVFGTESKLLLPASDPILIRRRAHDFARKLVWGEKFHEHIGRRDVLYDDDTEDAIRRLMECLQLDIPSTKKRPTWERAHFFPYTKSLIHWDAREKTNGISIERRYLRGGGALAFHILRLDRNAERLKRMRDGFSTLFSLDSYSPLEQLSNVLATKGKIDDTPRPDDVEKASSLFDDEFEDL